MKQGALLAIIALSWWCTMRAACASVDNIASAGTPIMGVAADAVASSDVIVANAGPIGEIIDGVANENLSPNAFIINGNGATGAAGNGADTYASGWGAYQYDYVGVLFATPQYGVSSVRVQNYLANDGGWWGSTSVISGGAPLTSVDLTAPVVQVTFDGGAAWSAVNSVDDYVSKYTGVVRGTGFPNATSGPFATFEFEPQNGINGVRLIGEGAGPADGSGFIGVNEFEVYGVPQQLALEVNRTTGRVRLVNAVQSPVSLDFYRIDSPSGSLDLTVGGWNSLESPSLNPAGFPAGSGVGDGWETLGTASNQRVAEAFLQGASTLAPGESLTLGRLFAGGAEDLSLRYRTAGGTFVDVAASYVSRPALAGDFSHDDLVDAADLAIWRNSFGMTADGDASADGMTDGSDFLVWQRQFGEIAVSVSAAVQAVPESPPGALVRCAISLLPALGRVSAARRAGGLARGQALS